MAKLKEEDVKRIRVAYPHQTMKELGLLYKVSSKQISVIISRKQWSHI